MKKVPLTIVIFSLSLSLAAQSGGKRSRGGTTPVATSLAAATNLPDVNTALADLERVSQATQSDIDGVHIDKWKSGWKTAFLKKVHKEQAQKAAASLQKNLTEAMPGLIHDVQNSRGSVSSTFKLYDDLSLVCELLDSLVSATESYGKKDEYGPLADDFSALIRIRRDLSTYVQQAAASVETRGKLPYAAASSPSGTSAQLPKKIIVDDTIPEKKPAKKKPEMLSNIE